MTLLLPALVLAILLVSVADVPGVAQADLILPMVLLGLVSSVLTSALGRRAIAAAFRVVRHDIVGHPESESATSASGGLRTQHRGHDRSTRRSMNRYIQTVVADLGTLSVKPTSATHAIREGRRVTADAALLDVGILTTATPYTSRQVHSGRT